MKTPSSTSFTLPQSRALRPEGVRGRISARQFLGVVLLLAAALLAMAHGVRVTSSFGLVCQEGDSCDEMGRSRWAVLFGRLPVVWLGALTYFLLALVSCLGGKTVARSVMVVQTTLAVTLWTAAAWFVGVQLVIFGRLCPICCLMHGLAALGAALVVGRTGVNRVAIFQLKKTKRSVPRWLVPATAVAALLVLRLGSWQEAAPEFVSNVAGEKALVARTTDRSALTFLGGEFEIIAGKLPLLNPQGTGTPVVAVTNFACPHCVRMVKNLRQVAAQLPLESAAVYLLPVAAEEKHAEATAILLAVWRADPSCYAQLADAVLEKRVNFTAAALRTELASQVTPAVAAAWLSAESMTAARAQVVEDGKIVRRADEARGLKGLPQLWFTDGATTGAAEDQSYYYDLLAQRIQAHRNAEPMLALAQREISLGQTPAGGRLVQAVEVSNPGQAPLEIHALHLPPLWKSSGTFPLKVAPGERVSLPVEIHSPLEPGAWHEEIKILSDASSLTPAIKFTGEVIPVLKRFVERVDLPDNAMGVLVKGQNIPLALFPGFEAGEPQLKFEGFEIAWASSERQSLILNQMAALNPGSHLGELRVPVHQMQSNQSWQVPDVVVAVAAHVGDALLVTPQRIVLSPLAGEHPQDFVVALRPRDGVTELQPEVTLPAELRAAGVTTSLGQPGARQTIELTFHFPPHFAASEHVGRQVEICSGLPSAAPTYLSIELPRRVPAASMALTGSSPVSVVR